ncbi:TolC family protein [Desulfovibrio mangrovi]|uniref:TolC family protein n=1 Tax=Desulfovibrio mangrovi TaxID=2976983 RepID=UPI0022458B01|nr:TolC family protein [Desulfovibrio mangrovi]UZP66929.1 TolC family protein [Desulfovibrio mangrovi]
MRIRKQSVLLSLLLVSLLAFSAHAEDMTYDLEGTVNKALKDNPSIEASRASALGAEEGRKAARGAFGPKLSTTYGYTYKDHKKNVGGVPSYDDDYYTLTASVSQPIFTGFNILSTYQKSELAKESAELAKDQTELALILNVQENFINLLIARENVRSAQATVDRLASQLKVTQAYYDVGLQPRIDVLRAEVQLSDAENALLQAENARETQRARLNTLLNLPLDADVKYMGELVYMPAPMDLEASLSVAAKARPDLLIARKAVEIAMKDLKITESDFYPQLAASFDWSRMGDHPQVDGSEFATTEFSEWSTKATMSWELFSWGTTYYAAQRDKQTIAKLKAEEAGTWQEALYEIKSRHLSIAEAAKRIKVAQKTVDSAQEAYRMALARYQAQVGTNNDVLDAQADLSSAEASYTKAQGDYMIAIARLYKAIGEKNPGLATAAK